MISLQEAVQIIDECEDPSQLVDNGDVREFLEGLDNTGTEILKDKDNEYLLSSIRVLRGASLAAIIANAEGMEDVMVCLSLLNSPTFEKLVTVIFKMTIGLAKIDELH